MAARNTTHMTGSLQRGLVKLYLKGVGAAAADITLTYGLGISGVIDQTGTGTYTITLTDKWAALIHASFNIIDGGTVDDWVINVVSETVATTKTILLTVFKGGAAANIPATATLTGEITLTNSAVLPLKG